MSRQKYLLSGAIAGATGGLLASWVMNSFIAGPGHRLQQSMQSDEQNREEQKANSEAPKQDATMKAADAIVSTTTGGQHLSWEDQEKAGPVVHYAFGALMGAFYGALAEYWPGARAGFGTTFGSLLFTGADLIAVPALRFGPSPTEQPKSKLVSPFSAHLVYGATTELVRRLIRRAL
jgi:putative membrane protein